MADKQASIRLGIEGAQQTISDVNKIAGAFEKIKASLGGITGIAKSASSAIANIKPFDPKAETDNLERYRLGITKLSVAMGLGGQAADYLRARFDRISGASGLKSDDIADAAMEYGRLTRDLRGAADSMEDLVTAANNSNRPLREMVQIGANLHNNLGVPLKGMGAEFRQIGRVAAATGTTGGRLGLVDMLSSLGPQIQKFDTSTPEARHRLEAFVAKVGGNLPHDAATEAAGAALGWISGDVMGLGRYLGRKTLIHGGKIDDPTSIIEAVNRKLGRSRDRARELRVLGRYANIQAAPNLLGLSTSEIGQISADPEEKDYIERSQKAAEIAARAKAMAPFDKAPPLKAFGQNYDDKLRSWVGHVATPSEHLRESDQLANTPAGELERANREGEIARRNAADKLLKARDRYQRSYKGRRADQVGDESIIGMLQDSPLLSTIGDAAHGVAAGRAALANDPGGLPPQQDRAVKLQEDTVRELKAMHGTLKSQGRTRDSHDVDRRKPHHQ